MRFISDTSYIPIRLGYGSISMQPESGTLCGLGSNDIVPANPKDEYFATIEIKSDLSLKELELTQFNQADYTSPRKNGGYICQLEGMS